MKKYCISIVLIVLLSPVLAQKAKLKIAEDYYNSYQFALATKEYEDILAKDSSNFDIKERLVLCYNKLNDAEREELYLAQVCQQEQVDSKYLKLYAEVLAKNEKYAESVKWYKKYASTNPQDKVDQIIEAYNHINEFYKYASFYKIKPVDFNSPQADFSPAFYMNGLVFCSSRDIKGKKYQWNNTSYINLYFENDSLAAPVPLSKSVNSSLHEGPVAFTSHYDTMYFTRNNSTDVSVIKLKICYTTQKNGVWGKAKEFELNSKQYSIGHPAFAPDGKLYFTSDMPGGFGGTDIYYTKKQNGKWITPVNLGASINTASNEMFPFINENGDLFFASNGHVGLGGLDIFQAVAKDSYFSIPKNLGSPINSSKDDFALIVKNNRGYFSSNRGEDYKDDNIYAFTIDKSKALNIVAYDQANQKIDHFSLSGLSSLFQKEPFEVGKVFTHVFDCERAYEIVALKEGYKKGLLQLSSDKLLTSKPYDTLKIILEEVIVEKNLNVALLSTAKEKLFGGKVILKNVTTGETKKVIVEKNTPVSFVLENDNSYEITGTKASYRSKTIPFSAHQVDSIADQALLSIILTSTNTLFYDNTVGQIIEMDIKYDVGKSNIKPEAAKDLDCLVEYLNKHSKVKVELGSHSDARGSDEANFKLSKKRSESAVNYIIAKGIKSSRLIPVGYGERDLKIENAVTEEQHQENRRTTVKIIAN